MRGSLDELARTLAEPMPRRRAVRVLAGAVAGFALPAPLVRRVLPPRRALCTPEPGGKACKCPSINGLFYIACCPAPAADWDCQCKAPPGGYAACVPRKCPSGHQCGGGECCKPGEFCANPTLHLCCKQGESACGPRCCRVNEECVSVRVGTGSERICKPVCPPRHARCGPSKCCPPKWRCANPSKGLCKRCQPNEEECGSKCCDRSTSRCCGKASCCPNGRACCVNGDKQTCCRAGQKCAPEIKAGAIGVQPGAKAVCCPPQRYHASPSLCCPAGTVAIAGAGLRVGPGLSPYCCPGGQACGSTCCQKSATLGSETCCSGTCADLRVDPNNCGSCGNVCSSGVCSGGVCAFS